MDEEMPEDEEDEAMRMQRQMEEYKAVEYHQVTLPSRFLRIDNIASFDNTQDLDDFKTLFSDVWDKASSYGTILQLKVPRPIFVDRTEQNKQEDLLKAQKEAEEEEKKAQADPKFVKKSERRKARMKANKEQNLAATAEYNELHPLQDKRNYDWPQGFGAVFVQFNEVFECIQARKGIHLLKYGEEQKSANSGGADTTSFTSNMAKNGGGGSGKTVSQKKADFVECSYLTEDQFKNSTFERDQVHSVEDLAKIFIQFQADDDDTDKTKLITTTTPAAILPPIIATDPANPAEPPIKESTTQAEADQRQ